MASSTLIRTTIRLSPQGMEIIKKRSLKENKTIQELIERAIRIAYLDKPLKKSPKSSGVHNLNLGIKEGATFSRDEIYSYLDEKF